MNVWLLVAMLQWMKDEASWRRQSEPHPRSEVVYWRGQCGSLESWDERLASKYPLRKEVNW
jgi:hypothetical protein